MVGLDPFGVMCYSDLILIIAYLTPPIVPSHHRALPDEYDNKPKQSHRSRSPSRAPQDRSDHSETRKSTGELALWSANTEIAHEPSFPHTISFVSL